MRALSIKQPFVEEILRGIKTIEYRTKACRMLDERFYIYASTKPAAGRGIAQRFARLGCEPDELPMGVIVGSAIVTRCTKHGKWYHWHLADVRQI